MITKRQIADSIAAFIGNDLMPRVDSSHAKFVLCMAQRNLAENDGMLDAFFASPLIASAVKVNGDEYDIDDLVMIMRNVLEMQKSYPLIIPKVPLLSPKETVVRITASDLDKLLSYMNEEEPAAAGSVL